MVGCDWGRTSVNNGDRYVCFIARILLFTSLPRGPSTNIDFYYVKNIIWRTQTKSSKRPCRFKTWMGFVRQILVKLETSFSWGFLRLPLWCSLGSNFANMLLATQWLLRRVPQLHRSLWYVCLKVHWSCDMSWIQLNNAVCAGRGITRFYRYPGQKNSVMWRCHCWWSSTVHLRSDVYNEHRWVWYQTNNLCGMNWNIRKW